MILEAFGPEANISKIARQYGINRNTLHEHVKQRLREAVRHGGGLRLRGDDEAHG
jgi:transposase-like protein